MRLLLIFALWATFLQQLITCDDFKGFTIQAEYYRSISKDAWNIYYKDYKGGKDPVVVADVSKWPSTLTVLHEMEQSHWDRNKDKALTLDEMLAWLWDLKGSKKTPPSKLYYKDANRKGTIQAATKARELRKKKNSSFEIRLKQPEHKEAWDVMMKSRYGEVAHDFAEHYGIHVSSISFERKETPGFEDITFYFKEGCKSCGGEHTPQKKKAPK
ncbi:hypothetical protein CH63R_09563 [Colletotrichum higginsianum IMI 349063]|uniref:EF-hand domain-containing protein n=2 Tax=Colletotrichum higginsianum TaxID=80884 RepID=A0A1B7Y7K7_COLHI|nr:hypothetical protein CH63R_09563 [Colletotrichum higginsianum IMI 349063]OBR08042.1 hypothetical protein CH63R_09563 [Colletotrichum higginsianum IMI 349063]TIC91797.1 hypothetical protein CH35J_010928 [Colletotrichum higginsianum]